MIGGEPRDFDARRDSKLRVIVFGATGGLGQWAWKAAVAAGHDVVAFARSPDKLDSSALEYSKLRVAVGDVMDAAAVEEASSGCKVAINCTSPAGGNSALEMARSIASRASASGVDTFYMVGGVGALWVPGSGQTVLVQDADFTDELARFGLPPGMSKERIQEMTKGHLASMAYMASTGLDHTFVCPGVMVEGPATSERVVTLDELGGAAVMRVNMGDIADVIVGDLGKRELIGHRVCVAAS